VRFDLLQSFFSLLKGMFIVTLESCKVFSKICDNSFCILVLDVCYQADSLSGMYLVSYHLLTEYISVRYVLLYVSLINFLVSVGRRRVCIWIDLVQHSNSSLCSPNSIVE